ncbi:hypothetical protein [Corynebacterium sp. UMB10119B.1]|uniref:hypothetical protein n=1 Tax=Corynebacterium sp. UMB10119B.1 TaxID=3050601 RepID=UPI002551AD9C|nr:hypothetical protein [Corynebacterium sp. UMB10119B]MDK8364738.1 hypothetical protein [Corynebacterium sp. UMB10119B]
MSEDKQLTVAELLARAQKTNPDVGKRPRRRRSLEEGGVSVAELTGSFKAVDARPAEAKHSSVPLDAPAEPAPAKPAAEKAEPAAAKPAAEKPVDPPAAAAKASPSEDETTQIRVVEDTKEPAQRTKAEPAEKPAEEDSLDLFDDDHVEDVDVEKVEPEADDGAVNPIMLVLFVFIGVVLGVLGFMLFSWIWANLATALAAILGAAAVAGVVFGVRAMHTGRDGLTMTLAGVAALVMAFGPALL